MKTIDEYMNDPSLADEPAPLREIHAARMLIHDKTKNMTPDELNAYYTNCLKEAQQKYGFKVSSSAKSAGSLVYH